jgi:hypothetical protein
VLIARYFPIFEHHPETVDYSIPDPFRKIESDAKPPAGEAAPERNPAPAVR